MTLDDLIVLGLATIALVIVLAKQAEPAPAHDPFAEFINTLEIP